MSNLEEGLLTFVCLIVSGVFLVWAFRERRKNPDDEGKPPFMF